jgi:hypothetical protein
MTVAKGAALKDPSGLFNSSLDGNVRRAIDIHEGDKIDVAALQDLIRAAVALNVKGNDQPKRKPKPKRASSTRTASRQRETHHGTRPATVPDATTRKSADTRIDATCLMRVVGSENSFG